MKRIAAFLLLACLSISTARAFDPFVVADIRIDGLQRISAGTVFSYLPIEKGDRIDRDRAAQAVRALFKTGFFNDVTLSRQGGILVIAVRERPAISKITLKGNKDIKEEELLKGLKDIGLAEGETFDRLQLDHVTQELTRQYYNRGKYNVSIKPKVETLDRNRVDIKIDVIEGKAARIKHINVVGNTAFTDKEIESEFESDTTNWTSWYSRDDQYSREKLGGDLEKLTSYYLDRGYVDFNIESTQVTISPDKRRIFLTANVREGEVYKIADIKLTGDLVLDEKEMRRLVRTQSGEIFSRKKLELTAEAMTAVLANIGYAFADVSPIPEVDKDKRLVSVTFFVNPGKRVYVRRIEFKGNTRTQDEVVRRELRQFEGAWFSQAAIDRSKVRLQRLGFFKEVNIETPKVAGTEDQIDVEINLEERSSGSFTFGLGYSQVQGIITSIAVQQNNFLGTGDRIGLTLQNNAFVKRFDVNYFDPYLTDSGVSIGYNLSLRELDQGEANIANYFTDTQAFSTYFGIPITETDTVNVSLGIDSTKIETFIGTPQPIIDYVNELGHKTFHAWRSEISWARDTRNKFFNPTRGTFQRVAAEVALPGSTQEYYKLFYQIAKYWPLSEKLTLLASGDIGYGDAYGNSEVLPFYENFYAGGVRSIRGFEDNTLGPFAASVNNPDFRQPLGGAFRTVGSVELIFPTPLVKDNDATRFSWFLDFGNVYEDVDAFEFREYRISTGLSFQWQAPVGPIIINLSYPIVADDEDEVERIQFSFGQQF